MGGPVLYAVGDIHGRQDLLSRLMEKIDADIAHSGKPSRIVFLGDYVDRGDRSREVVETLHTLSQSVRDIVFLRGNHEDIMLRFIDGDDDVLEDWLHFGGTTTLGSYGINPFALDFQKGREALRDSMNSKIPAHHLSLLRDTVFSHSVDDYLFVHAGVDPTKTIQAQTPEDFMWSRRNFMRHTGTYGKIIVYGHTIHEEPEVTPHRIGIDTGAYASGTLTCVRLSDKTHHFITT
ncbi:MAG: metallophosphoesterase [Alphaproteobacteria bacterium]|nr:metallophosphoesterase [Alphaproteobacteria bacterium]